MKAVQYEDKDGFLLQTLLPDHIPSQRADQGIPYGPPDVRQLDCDLILKELNELLIHRGLLTIKDINQNNNLLSNTILLVMKSKIIELYKNHPSGLQNGKSDGNIKENK